MLSQLQSRGSSKSIMAWLCLSASVSTGVRAAFVRNAPSSTRSAAFLHSLNTKPLNRQAKSIPTSLSVSTAAVESTEGYDVINKERGLDTYDPSSFESDIYSWWENAGCFQPDAKQQPYEGQKESYVLPMPPPNVTGRLHMGHAIFVALQDVLARFHRMRGRPVLWLPGTDHAGIATQLQVEKQLMEEGELLVFVSDDGVVLMTFIVLINVRPCSKKEQREKR